MHFGSTQNTSGQGRRLCHPRPLECVAVSVPSLPQGRPLVHSLEHQCPNRLVQSSCRVLFWESQLAPAVWGPVWAGPSTPHSLAQCHHLYHQPHTELVLVSSSGTVSVSCWRKNQGAASMELCFCTAGGLCVLLSLLSGYSGPRPPTPALLWSLDLC